jgi:hypothetical protein
MDAQPNSSMQRMDQVIEDLIIREYEIRRTYAREVRERGGTVGPFYGGTGSGTYNPPSD